MRLLTSQVDVIANAIHASMIANAKASFTSAVKRLVTKHRNESIRLEKERTELHEQARAIQRKLDENISKSRDNSKAFGKAVNIRYDINVFGSLSEEYLLDRAAEAAVPELRTIKSEVILASAFSKNEDVESFIKRVTDKIKK